MTVERTCAICGRPEREAGLLMVASEDGRVVVGGFKPGTPGPSSDPRTVVDIEHAGKEVHAGDVVCWRHTAVRSDGNYVRVDDGA